MNFNLIPILQIYVGSKQKYDLFTVCNVKFENKILVAMETEILNSCLKKLVYFHKLCMLNSLDYRY